MQYEYNYDYELGMPRYLDIITKEQNNVSPLPISFCRFECLLHLR